MLEKIYFQIKAIKETNHNVDFDGIIKNLEFECMDGAIGKLLDLSSFIENNPKKWLFEAKFEYIKQLAAEDVNAKIKKLEDPLDIAEAKAMHIHSINKYLNYGKHLFGTSLEKDDMYVNSNPTTIDLSDFFLLVSNKFENGEAAKEILEILYMKFQSQLPEESFLRMEINGVSIYRQVAENIQKTFKNFGFNNNLSEEISASLIDINEDGSINGYVNNSKEIIKCGLAKYLEAEGYSKGLIMKVEGAELLLLGDYIYKFDIKSRSYTELLNTQKYKNLLWALLTKESF